MIDEAFLNQIRLAYQPTLFNAESREVDLGAIDRFHNLVTPMVVMSLIDEIESQRYRIWACRHALKQMADDGNAPALTVYQLIFDRSWENKK